MGHDHMRLLAAMGVPADRLRLLRSFEPGAADPPPSVRNPYGGTLTDFEGVYAVIAAALPGLHEWLDKQRLTRTVSGTK